MSAQTHGSPTRPPRSLEAGLLSVDVPEAIAQLRSEPAFMSDGRNSETIASDGPARVIVTAVEAGRDVGADTSDGHVAIVILEGGGTISRAGIATRVGVGSVTILAPGAGWSLRVEAPTVFVASFWQPA